MLSVLCGPCERRHYPRQRGPQLDGPSLGQCAWVPNPILRFGLILSPREISQAAGSTRPTAPCVARPLSTLVGSSPVSFFFKKISDEVIVGQDFFF